MVANAPPEASKEIEFVKSLVAKRFPVYDVRVTYDVVQFFCKVDETTLEKTFEELREDMAQHGFIPMITYEKGEHIIVVAKRPPAKYRSITVNIIMLILTLFTTIFSGIYYWAGYQDIPANEMFAPESVIAGTVLFALPLLAIIGVHELGHFFAAKRRKVRASLPFFIPFIPPIGTFGAAISLRDPIPNRKVLMEIGVAGPIAGILVAIPIGIAGLILTNIAARPIPDTIATEGLLAINFPLIYLAIAQLIPATGDYLLHPTAFAAWVGFFVTAINLLPAGQLDGGHVARALLGDRAKYASWITIAILIGLSVFYFPWVILAVLVMFLGARHPPPLNDINKLDLKRKFMGIAGFAILVIAIIPIPMTPVIMDYTYHIEPVGQTNVTIVPGDVMTFQVLVEDQGNTWNNISFEKLTSPSGWNVSFKQSLANDSAYRNAYWFRLNQSVNQTIDVRIASTPSAAAGQASVMIRATSEAFAGDPTYDQKITYIFNITHPLLTFWAMDDGQTIIPNSESALHVMVNNSGVAESNLTFVIRDVPAYMGAVLFLGSPTEPNTSSSLNVTVPAAGNTTVGVEVFVWRTASPGEKTIMLDILFTDVLVTTLILRIVVP
jgi:membrane-associated protease RseP (regulator of RpoE activity)